MNREHTLQWNLPEARGYEAGLDRGVLYPSPSVGVVWNGLISVDHTPVGGELTPNYIDGYVYHHDVKTEHFTGSLQAYTYPDELQELDGVNPIGEGLYLEQQTHKSFGLSYRTFMGNGADGINRRYRIHMLYNVQAAPSTKNYSSIGSNITPNNFTWSFVTSPIFIPGRRPSAKIYIDSKYADPDKLAYFESILYGFQGTTKPRLPDLTEVIELFDPAYILPTLEF